MLIAAQAMATIRSDWHQPSATSGFLALRASSDPTLLPSSESEQKHRENDRERIDRRAKQQRQQPRPDDLRAERGQPRHRDRQVDGHGFQPERNMVGDSRRGRRAIRRNGRKQKRERGAERVDRPRRRRSRSPCRRVAAGRTRRAGSRTRRRRDCRYRESRARTRRGACSRPSAPRTAALLPSASSAAAGMPRTEARETRCR